VKIPGRVSGHVIAGILWIAMRHWAPRA
jgi:predicted cation transporter